MTTATIEPKSFLIAADVVSLLTDEDWQIVGDETMATANMLHGKVHWERLFGQMIAATAITKIVDLGLARKRADA